MATPAELDDTSVILALSFSRRFVRVLRARTSIQGESSRHIRQEGD
jgi:hypothetical protein